MITATKPAALRYSVVVPVYNEHEMIVEFCAKAVAELPKGYELLICYDMDEDTTLPALKALAPSQKPPNIRLIKNELGKGVRYAIDAGMRAAKTPIVVVMMADVSDDFAKVGEMVSRAEAGADVVCASRYMKGGRQIGGPKLKGFLSRMAGLTLYYFTGLPTHDPTNSFKAYRKSFLEKTPIESTAGFSLGLELTAKAHFAGGKVEEVPATWLDRTAGQSRFKLMKWLPMYLRWYFWAYKQRLVGATVSDYVYTAIQAMLWLFTLTLFIPWKVSSEYDIFPPSDLDSSWYMVLPWAWRNGLQYGRDLVFTYGPWGFVLQGYDPPTFSYVVAYWTTAATLVFIVAARLANRLTPRRWIGTLVLLFIVCLAGISPQLMPDMRLSMLGWVLLILHFYVDDRPLVPTKIALTLVLALVSLGKISMMFVAMGAIGAISLDEMLRRKVPYLLLIYGAGVLVFWTAAGQSLLGIGPFIYHALQVTFGYAQGEGLFAANESTDISLFVICSLLVVATVVLATVPSLLEARRRDAQNIRQDGSSDYRLQLAAVLRTALLAAGISFALFMNFKAGYVRHDEHAVHATAGLTVLAILCFIAIWPTSKTWVLKSLGILTILCSVSLTWYAQVKWTESSPPWFFWEEVSLLPARVGRAVDWTFGGSKMSGIYQGKLDEYRNSRPLPNMAGTVDIYPYAQRALLAGNLQYRPRPVFQSYLAFTTELAKLNADFIRGSNAPDNLFFDIEPIDDHYPSMEDGTSWPEILSRYALVDASTSALHYRRMPQPLKPELVKLQDVDAKIEQWLGVPYPPPGLAIGATQPATPQLDLIWATVALHPKLPGSLLQVGYKPPPIYMDVVTSNGTTSRYRVVPEVARGGFLLSPYISDRMSFALLSSPTWRDALRDSHVMQVMFNGGQDASFGATYDRDISVSFYQLKIPHYELSGVQGIEKFRRFRELVGQLQFAQTGGKPQMMVTNSGMTVLIVPGATQMVLPPRPNIKAIKVIFGVYDGPGVTALEPVNFSAYALTPNDKDPNQATTQRFWSVQLDPVHNPAHRRPQAYQISLPTPTPARIMLETAPASDHPERAFPYWAEIEFE